MNNTVTITLDVKNIPEIIASTRREMARQLRDEAEGEPEIVRKKLLEIAADFEVGIKWSEE